MAFVSRRSATRRSSFALASVVSILSCRTRFAVKLRSMARLLLVFRSNFRPAFLWRMSGSSLLQPGLGRARPQCDAPFARMRGLSLSLLSLPPFDHLRPVVDLHSEREPHVRKDFLDLFEALAAEVLGLQHVLLGALNQLADEGDVGVLQAVGGSNRELELVDGAEEVLVEGLVLRPANRVACLLGLFE